MPNDNSTPWFQRRTIWILTAALILQGALYHGFSRQEQIPLIRSLKDFPTQLGGWSLLEEGVIEDEVQKVLQADDALTRHYGNPQLGATINYFVAYFRTQRNGKAPHSPKNCLPGSGWTPSESAIFLVPIPGAEPIEVNRYIVVKGEYKSLVLYWYQSHNRAIASEYKAKVFLVLDSMRYNRSDTALVRVTAPIAGDNTEAALAASRHFVQTSFPALRTYLPSL